MSLAIQYQFGCSGLHIKKIHKKYRLVVGVVCRQQAAVPPVPRPLHKELILGRANKAHTSTVLAGEPIVRKEEFIVEAHEVRAVVAIVVRSRPVEATGTDEVDIGPESVARSGQEDCPVGLESVSPVALRDTVAAETRSTIIRAAQAVVRAVPVVR